MTSKYFILIILATLITGCASLTVGTAELTGMSLFHDRRSMDNVTRDEQIETEINLKWLDHDVIREHCHLNVTVFNGLVLITGEVFDRAIRDRISTMAQAVNGVRFIRNHTLMRLPSSLADRSDDNILTAKIKLRFSQSPDMPGLDATRIKVVTENGHVFLMGLVYKKEAEIAVENARRVEGVIKVIKVFEFL
ncbi:MAG: BON domain-containing protein [Methylococcales bacterium]|nr:BON domain-containing protein [Methylococcales bacterium]